MRTTVTLDPDTTQIVRRRMAEHGIGFKEAINAAIRDSVSSGDRPPFRTPTFSMGTSTVDLTQALALAGELEDDDLVHRMHRGS